MLLASVTEPREDDRAGSSECDPSGPKASAVEQGQAHRGKAAAATQVRLVDSDEAPDPTMFNLAIDSKLRGCACRKSNTYIQMMESAKKWRRHNATNGMYRSRRRRVLVD